MKKLFAVLYLVACAQSQPSASYHWIPASSSATLRTRLNAAGDSARVEFRTDANNVLTIRVVPLNTMLRVAGDSIDIDDSRLCPPICP